MTGENDWKMSTSTGLRSVWLRTTSWTLIKAAARAGGDNGGGGGEDERREFFERYYRPVCAYIAVIARDASVAEDYASDFFVEKVFKAKGGGLLEQVDQKRKFRPYLKAALRNYLKDRWKKQNWIQERGEFPDGDDSGWGAFPGGDSPEAEDVFHREWVRMLLALVLEKVRVQCEEAGQPEYLEIFLARFACDDEKPPSWREIGAHYDLDEKLARRRADTVQRRFRAALREALIDEERSPEAADEELATLLAVMRSAQ